MQKAIEHEAEATPSPRPNRSDFVDGRVYKDAEEMCQINAAAAAKGYVIICDRCKNLSEPIVAVITLERSDEAFGFCGECFREVSRDFMGHVV